MGFALSFAVDTFVKVVKLRAAKVLEREMKIWEKVPLFFFFYSGKYHFLTKSDNKNK